MGLLMEKFCSFCRRVGTLATEPFVGYNGEGVLVAGGCWEALQLFWRHIGRCCCRLMSQRGQILQRKGEIGEQGIVFSVDEQVAGVEVAMQYMGDVRVMERAGDG